MMGSGLECRRKLIKEKIVWESFTAAEMIAHSIKQRRELYGQLI
jgi:hypothetical protein